MSLTSALAAEPKISRDIPYVEKGHERQVLDVYAPPDAKHLPVVFWIHGGGWQAGDKAEVQLKPQAFVDHGFVFVAMTYRLLPQVEMGEIIRDITASKAPASSDVAPRGNVRSESTRSSAHPHASLTIHGSPLAIASFTTRPHVS